jgi:3-deoxy-7-phosphoheptulonate synthase
MDIHRQKGTILGGVHLELTGEVNDEGYSVVCLVMQLAIGDC